MNYLKSVEFSYRMRYKIYEYSMWFFGLNIVRKGLKKL